MSEELKKTDIKKIAGRGCLIVAGILFLIFLCRYNQIKKESLYDTEGRTFAKATVMNVLQDNETKDGIYIGRQLVKLKITSGKWKGKSGHGVGLGNIIKRVWIMYQDGQVIVRSEKKKGTCITIGFTDTKGEI